MKGRLTALTPTDGTLASATEKSCPYHFTEAQFLGDWAALQSDYGGGATVMLSFARNPTTPGEATAVRRIP